MSDYRRYFVPGGTFFFTLVAYNRREILTTDVGRKLLRQAIQTVDKNLPFKIIATVLLPDHWHLVMQLPNGDDNFSARIRRIKEVFTKSWLSHSLTESVVTQSQSKRGERGVWQPRFWEHSIQDEDDLIRCVDYIHWNPRKHKLVSRVRDWPWSSFHRFVSCGDYSIEWGGEEPTSIVDRVKMNWGE